jgi:DUF4097 and DUF4098 domain-containing protein YvlB
MWRCHSLAVLVVVGMGAVGCGGVNGDVTAGQGDASTVNGSIHVPAGQHSGNLGTVNGSVYIADNATVGTAGTVNGAIELGAHAMAESADTVNGWVTLAAGAHVTHEVKTVNGSLNLNTGAEVGGSVGNVNGHIALTAAHVAGGLQTVSGDIDVAGASRVDGGIVVEKGNNGWFNWNSHKPRIVIGPGAVVNGPLRFERDVELYVSDKATIGPITGATAIRFSGNSPPPG